jgi:uncharacterized protein YoxC
MRTDRPSPETVQTMLSGPIDPSDPSFWADFKKRVLKSPPDPLDRRGIMNLKLMFNGIAAHPDRLTAIVYFLKLLKGTFAKAEIASEIAFTLAHLAFTDRGQHESETVEFVKVTGLLCAANPLMRSRVFEETIEPFADALAAGLNVPTSVLTALFEFEITMISQCPENWKLVGQTVQGEHLSKCFELITQSRDSLSQMLMAEWLWRVRSKRGSSPGRRTFGQFEPLFEQITPSNFRSALHSFVRAVNQQSSAPSARKVLHIGFKGLELNARDIGCRGFIDVNADTLAVWLFEKRDQLPDVVVFRTKHVVDPATDATHVRFTTREKLAAFDRITTQKPISFTFTLEKTEKAVLTEFLARCNPATKPAPPRKAVPRGRVLATRTDEVTPTRVRGKLTDKLDDHDLFTDMSTQDKQVSVEEIDRQVTDFFNKSKRSIEDLEAKITTELQEIIAKLADQRTTLGQFAQQHRNLTESTTIENARIAGVVSALEAEFEARHGETTKKREALAAAVMQDIVVEKKRFLEETRAIFQQNAIIGLSNNISTLQETMCATFA